MPEKRKATKAQVMNAIKKAGATFDEEIHCSLIADLPAGKCWNANGCHAVCSAVYDDEPKSEAWGDLLEQIEYGVTDCEDDDCEVCHS